MQMTLVKNYKCISFIKFICIYCFIFIFSAEERFARTINHKEFILSSVLKYTPLLQYYVETETTVYNPEVLSPLHENLAYDIPPFIAYNKDYKQKILWIRNEYLGVETYSSNNKLLHVYYQNLGNHTEKEKNISKDRFFNVLDAVPVYPFFYNNIVEKSIYNYEFINIDYRDILLARKKFDFFYKIGNKDSYLLVDIKNYRPMEYKRNIFYNNKATEYKIKFIDWQKNQPYIPKIIEHYVAGRPIKTDKIITLRLKKLSTQWKQMLVNEKKYTR